MQKSPIPVFIISYNRGWLVENLINSMNHLVTDFDFVVHDNGSDEPETLEILEKLRQKKVKIKRNKKINHADELNLVNNTVTDYFRTTKTTTKYYIVTDCDLDFSEANENAVKIYCGLLNYFKTARCVGPMLTIEDIPKTYPLYNHVMNRHISQFWGKQPTIIKTNLGQVAFQRAVIDTTFAVHHRNEPFRRLKHGLRVYRPYEARHLDWYSEDQKDYSVDTNISHWANTRYTSQYWDTELKNRKIFVINDFNNGKNLICRNKLVG